MKTEQLRWTEEHGWGTETVLAGEADVVLVFADHAYFYDARCYADLAGRFPNARIVGCSSAGSIAGVELVDQAVLATAVVFEHGRVRLVWRDLEPGQTEYDVGKDLMHELAAADLRHAFVLSDGLQVNGSTLADGLNQAGISVTGGLAGDGDRFVRTGVMADGPTRSGRIAALGFYGDVAVRSGCFAGWQEFGAVRQVTESRGNVVYQIDGEPALALYKRYLGELADELPYSGLRFPLSIQADEQDTPLIRTLLAVDEQANSLTFAGDVPQGYLCKLMQTGLEKLIDSAGMAAAATLVEGQAEQQSLCLMVSCVGRRLVMGQLTEDELDIVQETLGDHATLAGFYSYGELAPFVGLMQCELHNQTMTLTTIYE